MALDEVHDGVWVAVIAGSHEARMVYPAAKSLAMARMDDRTRADAKAAVSRLYSDGGTAMGTWLRLATSVFAAMPDLAQKHAILLTDGDNQHETPQQLTMAIDAARGQFQCDCRGVGVDWKVEEVRRIATALLGSVDLIAKPDQMAADFESIMRESMGRGRRGRHAARVGTPGSRDPVRSPGLPHRRRPHCAAEPGQRPHLGVPDRLLGRRGP